MPTKSKSHTTTKTRDVGNVPPSAQRLLQDVCHWNGPPTHPGEMLIEEFLKPMGISQSLFAKRLGVSYSRLNKIICCRQSLTPDIALCLARVIGMSADFWLGLQQDWDL